MNESAVLSYPLRRTSDLLIGRRSIPGARYFITFCEAQRRAGITCPEIAAALKRTLDQLHGSGDLSLIAATLMPDHAHLLGVLGARLSLSRLVGRIKAATRTNLKAAELVWQENYYDHRLHDESDQEPFARYIFLNPYRARLIALDVPWPCWWRWGGLRFEFEAIVARDGCVPREWLGEADPEGAADF